MAGQPIQVQVVPPPSKGVTYKSNLSFTDSSHAINLLNCYMADNSRLRRRPALTAIHTTALVGETINYIYEYVPNGAGASTVFCHTTSGKIYKLVGTTLTLDSAAGTWTGKFRVTQMNGLMLLCDGITTPKLYNGTTYAAITTMPDVIASTVIGNIPIIHKGRGYVAGDAAFPTTIFYSDPASNAGLDAWNQTATTTWGGAIDVGFDLPDGDTITGLASFMGQLIVFCRNHILFYQSDDPNTSLTLNRMITNEGCLSHDSIQGFENDLMYLSPSGFKSLKAVWYNNNAAVNGTGQEINPLLIRYHNQIGIVGNNVIATYIPKYDIYLCSINATDALLYQPQMKAWMGVWRGLPTASFTSSDGTVYMGGDTLYKLDHTVHQDGLLAGATPITMEWWTSPTRSENLENRLKANRVHVYIESSIQNESLDIVISPSNDASATTTTNVLGVEFTSTIDADSMLTGMTAIRNFEINLPLVGRAEKFQLKLINSSNSDFYINHYELLYIGGSIRQ